MSATSQVFGSQPESQPQPSAQKRVGKAAPNLATLPQGVVGQIFKFLTLEEMSRGTRTCSAFKMAFRLWQQRAGNVDAHHLVCYIKRRGEAAAGLDLEKGKIPPDAIQEMLRVGERIETLGLFDFAIRDLLNLFPRQAEEGASHFPNVHTLEVDLGFSRGMDNGWAERRRGAHRSAAPAESYDNERIFNMIRALASHCPQLREISLKGVSKENGFLLLLELFQRTPHLTALNFVGYNKVDAAAVAKFCPGLKRLRVVGDPRFGGTLCDCANIQSLFSVPQLQELDARLVDDEAMAKIPDGHKLEAIKIQGSLTTRGLENITRLSCLQRVHILNSSAIKDLSCLGKVRNLSSLVLQAWYAPTDPLLRSLAQHGNIRELTLNDCCRFADEGFAEIAKCARLRLLDIRTPHTMGEDAQTRGQRVTDEALRSLARCQELEHLALEIHNDDRVAFTTVGMIKLALSLPKLATLNLQKFRQTGFNVAEIENVLHTQGSKVFVMRRERDDEKSPQ